MTAAVAWWPSSVPRLGGRKAAARVWDADGVGSFGSGSDRAGAARPGSFAAPASCFGFV